VSRYRVHHGFLSAGRYDVLVHVHEQPTEAPTVLVCSALGVSCTEPRYLMTLLARRLADEGATVVQYDHPADGDSTGDPGMVSAADLFEAGRRMFDYTSRLAPGPMALVGYGGGNAVTVAVVPSTARRRAVACAPASTAALPTIVSIGRFKPRKNQLALLDAVAMLYARGLPVRCVFAGSCDAASVAYRDELVSRGKELDGAVEVVEDADDTEIERLLAVADLVVQPARAEGLGLASIEALVAGRTVLCTPNTGARELLGDVSPLLAAGFTGIDLAATISDALDRPDYYADAAARAARSIRRRSIRSAARYGCCGCTAS
jgi:glycosyltransferase involved in cell wall biosynthesis